MKRTGHLVDLALGLLLGVSYVVLLVSTVESLGYARDEGFYFQAARAYGGWFDLLFADPDAALTRASVDRAWVTNSEHPAFIKSLFALSHKMLHVEWKVFEEAGTAYRFPGMVLSGMAVTVTHLWGARAIGRLAGVVAALLFAMLPRVFYHAHLDCFDMPVLAMWLVVAYAYWRSLEPGSILWAIAAGLLYGLLLNTKHNAWLLPPAIVVHVVLSRGTAIWRDFKRGRVRVPLALFTMATLGPLVFYATWPWIWHDTGARLAKYVSFHVGHVYYNMEFLGQTYFEAPMPLGYAWLMTFGTVPAITLTLFVIGLAIWAWPRGGQKLFRRLYSPAPKTSVEASLPASDARPLASQPELLWLLCIAVSYAPWLSPSTPIFGGTKHWLTAYPFMCLFAASGFVWVLGRIRLLVPAAVRGFGVAEVGLLSSVIVAPILITLESHPWGLTAYTPAVGGAPGAATLGLNRGFWGYTTGAVQGVLNETAPKRASVFLHDTAQQSWAMMVRDGRVRKDLRGVGSVHGSTMALYHHEQHMSRVEYQIWMDYGTVAPKHVGTHDGVPVVMVYSRPEKPAR